WFMSDGAEHLDLLRHAFRERLDLLALNLAQPMIGQKRVGAFERFASRRALKPRKISNCRTRAHATIEPPLLRQITNPLHGFAIGGAAKNGYAPRAGTQYANQHA